MAVDNRITTDINYNEDKVEVEGDPLEIIQPGAEEEVREFVEDSQGNMQPLVDNPNPEEGHDSNLALYLSDEDLDSISIELMTAIEEDKSSRQDWETQYTKGLDLLGFKYEERTRPFRGASAVTHPVLSEAAVQFQSQAYKELLPANGPVKTSIIGQSNEQLEEQAQRVRDYMNYQITYVMKDYETETDQMLFYLPLAGSAFRKIFFDSTEEKARSQFVPAEDLVVPYGASYLDDAERVTHIIKMNEIELKKKQIFGMYRDVDVRPFNEDDQVQDKYDQLEGVKSKGYTSDMYTLYESHCYLDLPGYEDPDGQKLPYIVTVDESSNKVLSIYRNYEQGDPLRKKKAYFVHYKFLPGLGFYGFGLIHMIGGLSRTATVALRQLLDAGTLSNLPAGFKARGIRIRDDDQPLQPGEFRDVDAPSGTIQGSLINLPYKGPDQTLFALLGFCVDAAKRFVSVADSKIGDAQVNQNAPVGTTVALMERGTMVMSSIHKRLHNSQKQEFQLLAKTFQLFLPPVYPYSVGNVNPAIKQQDFDDRIDIIPVSDPSMFSMSQRIAMAQTQLQMAQSAPEIHNIREAYRRMYVALRVPNIEQILPEPQQPQPMDPGMENANSMRNLPLQVFPGQDHMAHIKAHQIYMSSNLVKNNMAVLMVLQAHIQDHISALANEEIQASAQQNLQEAQQQGIQLSPEEVKAIQVESQNAIAKRIVELTQQLVEEEKQMMPDAGKDPLVNLKEEELNIRKADLIRRTQDDQNDSTMEIARLAQKDEIDKEKIEVSRERNAINIAKNMLGS
tara:strand:+ start:4380 stop:6749 length:2370 start_codon:yes stop_codon:yes gene_type:complete